MFRHKIRDKIIIDLILFSSKAEAVGPDVRVGIKFEPAF